MSSVEATSKTLAFALMHRLLEGDGHDHGDDGHVHGDEFHDDHHEDDDDDDSKPWGDVILASFLVQLVTFSGLLVTFLIGTYNRYLQRQRARSGQGQNDSKAAAAATEASIWSLLNNLVIPSFAAGALLATAVFLLLPESLALIQGGHDSHNDDAHDAHEDEDQDDGHNHDHRTLTSITAAKATIGATGRVLRAAAKRSMEEEGEGDEDASEHAHEEGHDNHNEAAWKFGASLLGGFLLPILLGAIFPPPHPQDPTKLVECEECELRKLQEAEKEEAAASGLSVAAKKELEDSKEGSDGGAKEGPLVDEEGCLKEATAEAVDHTSNTNKSTSNATKDDEAAGTTDMSKEPVVVNWPLVGSIILGDAFHNFTDGIFIGNAFLLCSSDVAYTITATTVYHEIAQEIADYTLLTHHCGLAAIPALALNFCAGFSCMLGAVLILAVDMSEMAMGVLLAISAGVYVNIGASECIPRLQLSSKTTKEIFLFFLWFTFGCIPIGLVLLNHGHCEEGHNH